ncbi:hypothetical protein P0Y35_11930 [Kiritimatiellaeota bacterium B1221]|nr:hypothetical protein [Kiritimatiellaeota bacterium B1221]
MSKEFWINLAGWIPAITLPLATLFQLRQLLKTRSAEGVSIMTWLLFGFANLGIYIFTEKYFVIQSLLAQLLTAILNFVIVGILLTYQRRNAP